MTKQNKTIAGSIIAVLICAAALVRFGAMAAGSTPSVVIENVQTLNLSGVTADDGALGGFVHNIQETFDAGIAVQGTEVISSSRGVTATTLSTSGDVAITGSLSQGEASSVNYVYFGTADGCGAMNFAASGTTPTLTPTSTSFCN